MGKAEGVVRKEGEREKIKTSLHRTNLLVPVCPLFEDFLCLTCG